MYSASHVKHLHTEEASARRGAHYRGYGLRVKRYLMILIKGFWDRHFVTNYYPTTQTQAAYAELHTTPQTHSKYGATVIKGYGRQEESLFFCLTDTVHTHAK
jgi:hypothetical protein